MKNFTLKMFAFVMALFMTQGMMAQDVVIFEEDFENDLGEFTVEGFNGVEGGANIWTCQLGYARGDAYGKITEENTNYLVSPEITLSTAGNSVNYVYYFVNYGQAAITEQMGFCIREVGGEWEPLEVPVCKESGDLISSGDIEIPGAYAGKKIQFAFKYFCESSGNAGVWCIEDVVVKEAEAPVPDIMLQEDFENDLGEFTVEGFNGVEGGADIWTSQLGYARGDAYGKITEENTNYLVSPAFKLSKTVNVASYNYYFVNYGQAAITEQMGFCVREVGGEWEALEIPVCKESGEIISSGDIIIPETYAGKTVQVAFKYFCESSGNAGVWCIEDIIVKKGDTTGIESIENVEAGDGKIYDLQGRRVINPKNGIYVINGKKVVVK